MIPVFNNIRYLPAAMHSVMEQWPDAKTMQIAVMDDASTDGDVRQLVRDVAGTRVEYFRHPANVGSLANFNTCLEKARGHYVHLLHADDRVLPGFYARVGQMFAKYPEAGAAFVRERHIDSGGVMLRVAPAQSEKESLLDHWLDRIALEQRLQYVSIAVRRSVYEDVGGFYGVTYGEDWEMWVRIASRYRFAYSPEVLAEYRIHQQSISYSKILSGRSIEDLLWVIDVTDGYLPLEKRKLRSRAARKVLAKEALIHAELLWRAGESTRLVVRHITRALLLPGSLRSYRAALRLGALMLLRTFDLRER
jgi:glycosyltransferase involved in cell wall biosynthesis